MPHNSSTAQKPKIKTNIFRKLVIHSIKSLVRICSIALTFEKNGLIIWLKNQKVTIVKIETFILYINSLAFLSLHLLSLKIDL